MTREPVTSAEPWGLITPEERSIHEDQGFGVESALAPGKNGSDDHQHDADRTPHRESLGDRAERADVIEEDRGDNLPGYNETDRGADAEPRRKVRDGYYVASDNESTEVAIGRHAPHCLQRRKWFACDDHPGCHDNEADCKEGERSDRHTADHATHRSVRGSLNGNERADDHGERTPQDNVQ